MIRYLILFAMLGLMLYQFNENEKLRSESAFYHHASLQALGLATQATDMAQEYETLSERYKQEVAFLRISRRIERVNVSAPANRIARAIIASSTRYGIDPIWMASLIEQESHYHVLAQGKALERGLVQMTRTAAQEVGLDWNDAFNVEQNVDAGAKYLSLHLPASGNSASADSMRVALLRYNGSDEYPGLVKARYVRMSQ
jgi:soluble lytic murein transglycosylase-like protein